MFVMWVAQTCPATIQTSVIFTTLQTYIFACLGHITFKFGSLTNSKVLFQWCPWIFRKWSMSKVKKTQGRIYSQSSCIQFFLASHFYHQDIFNALHHEDACTMLQPTFACLLITFSTLSFHLPSPALLPLCWRSFKSFSGIPSIPQISISGSPLFGSELGIVLMVSLCTCIQ